LDSGIFGSMRLGDWRLSHKISRWTDSVHADFSSVAKFFLA
jgi:hypothetical protein